MMDDRKIELQCTDGGRHRAWLIAVVVDARVEPYRVRNYTFLGDIVWLSPAVSGARHRHITFPFEMGTGRRADGEKTYDLLRCGHPLCCRHFEVSAPKLGSILDAELNRKPRRHRIDLSRHIGSATQAG